MESAVSGGGAGGSYPLHPGDPSRRVTVPIPRTLPELQSQATRHFGRDGAIRLYHQGVTPITQPQQITNLHSNDVVVVEFEPRPPEAPNRTTHQEHYVPHPLEARAPPARRTATANGVSPRFEGNSSYALDYVEHPIEVRKPAQPARAAWETRQSEEPTGKSMYATHYPWHEVTPRTPLQRQVKQFAYQPAQFEGVTSYKTDYVKHTPQRPRTAVSRPRERMMPGPFEGATTYNVDYHRHLAPETARPIRREAQTAEPVPFEGATEYHREYVKKDLAEKMFVHLEPSLKWRNARGTSAPAGRR